MSKLFVVVFFVVAAAAIGMMFLGMCEAPAPEAPNLSAEEQNYQLSLVEFELRGAPTGEAAIFINGDTIVTRLNPGQKAQVSLDGNERCSASLQIRPPEGEWQSVHSFSCFDYGVSIGLAIDGTAVEVAFSSQF